MDTDGLDVALLVHEFWPRTNGSARTGIALARRFRDQGHRVVVFTTAYADAPAGTDEFESIPVHRFRPRRFRWWHLPHASYRRTVAGHHADVWILVHQNTWMSNQVTDLWRLMPGRRVYLPIEFDPASSKAFRAGWTHRLWNRTIHRQVLIHSHLVVGVTEHETALLRAWLPSDIMIECVPLGVGQRAFAMPDTQALRKRYRLPEAGYLLHISSEAENKRRDLGLDLAQREPDNFWVFAGEGTKGLKGPNYVGLGRVPDRYLPALYAGAHAHVQTSNREGFGFTLLESLAQGTPFVSGPVGVAPELADRDAGVVVADLPGADAADSIDAFAAGVQKVLHDDWSSVALRRVANDYTWEEAARQIEDHVSRRWPRRRRSDGRR